MTGVGRARSSTLILIPWTTGTLRRWDNGLLRGPELVAVGHGRSLASQAAAFFAELVLLTQLPVLRSQFRDLG